MSLERTHSKLFENPRQHSGACGTGFVSALDGVPSREISKRALAALLNLEHRGGTIKEQEKDGSWGDVSDGAGILFGTTRETIEPSLDKYHRVPEGERGLSGMIFLPKRLNGTPADLTEHRYVIEERLRKAGLVPLGFRVVPTNPEVLGRSARLTAPHVVQFLFGQGAHDSDNSLNRALFQVEQDLIGIWEDAYYTGDNAPTLVSLGQYMTYKARATSPQLIEFYPDLKNLPPAAVAIFHRRKATNTDSTWGNTQPVLGLAENGENNAVAANRNEAELLERRFYRADYVRAGLVEDARTTGPLSTARGERIRIIQPGASDSRDFAAFLNYLTRRQGLSLEEAIRITVLPAFWERSDFSPQLRDWFMRKRHQLGPLSAWGEGPKLGIATQGHQAIAVMNRMGDRPAFWFETEGGIVGVCSEPGAIPMSFDELKRTGRLRGGDIFVADTRTHQLLLPSDVHEKLLGAEGKNCHPPAQKPQIFDLGDVIRHIENPSAMAPRILMQYGWTKEEMDYVNDWLRGKMEPRGAMGRDWAEACLSNQHPPAEKYVKQVLASCMNRANDPEVEGGVIDTSIYLGSPDEKGYALKLPVVTPLALHRIESNVEAGAPKVVTLDCMLDFKDKDVPLDTKEGAIEMGDRIDLLVVAAVHAVKSTGASIIVLTHRNVDGEASLPIPTFLVSSAINEALIEQGLDADIIVDSPGIRDRHDMMVNYLCGVSSICPSAIFERARQLGVSVDEVESKLRDAVAKGMSLIGVTSFSGFRGSKNLEFIGFGPELMKYFPGFMSKVGGIGLEDLYEDMLYRANKGRTESELPRFVEARRLPPHITKKEGPVQKLAITGDFKYYEEMERLIAEQGHVRLWDLLEILPVGEPILIEEVISEAEILNEFIRIANMSDGALSELAHRAFARFANRHRVGPNGIVSGSGEGAESLKRRTGGMQECDASADREVASARFGVTIEWVADRGVLIITLKIHQGAKPNESADMPAGKNDVRIAGNRFVEPGTRLRSLVTNLDLLSIEDFLGAVTLWREANPNAIINIKIASNSGNDIITTGLAKAAPDEITISGGEGGTGSASLQAIHRTGFPGEYGLADSHRGLVKSALEEQITLAFDGGLLLADDVLHGLALGGRHAVFGTAAMQAVGCWLLRKCNVPDGCKPGVATQDPRLVKNFVSLGRRRNGDSEAPLTDGEKEVLIEEGVRRLENFFIKGLCHAIRKRCAELGARSPLELYGRTNLLRQRQTGISKLDKLDLSYLITRVAQPGECIGRVRKRVERVNTTALGIRVLEDARAAIARGGKNVELAYEARNIDQAIGVRLAGEKVRNPDKFGDAQITLRVNGTPGHGCFALLHRGMHGVLEGIGGDMFGASLMDGASVVAKPSSLERYPAVGDGGLGNVCLYGSTGGDAYLWRGVGENFCAGLSGARVVQEGPIGKDFAKTMRKGVVVHLGGGIGDSPFCGMTGGKIYALGEHDLEHKITHDSVILRRELRSEEEAEIKGMVFRYAEKTGSPLAARILDNWDVFRLQWTVVEANKDSASSAVGVKHQGRSYYEDVAATA